jgi:hypothetical protein
VEYAAVDPPELDEARFDIEFNYTLARDVFKSLGESIKAPVTVQWQQVEKQGSAGTSSSRSVPSR